MLGGALHQILVVAGMADELSHMNANQGKELLLIRRGAGQSRNRAAPSGFRRVRVGTRRGAAILQTGNQDVKAVSLKWSGTGAARTEQKNFRARQQCQYKRASREMLGCRGR